MLPIRIKACSESDLRMLGNLARNIQRVLPVTQADIDAAAALGKGWVVWKVIEVNDPIDNLRGGTQLVIKQNSITPGQNVRRVLIVSGPSGQVVVIGPDESPLLLPDAIADTLSYVKAYGGTEQRNLPVGYTQLAYIGSAGTQYIDLGIKGNGNTKVSVEYRYHTNTSASGSGRVFGSRTSSTSNAFAIGTASGIVSETGNKVFWCYDSQSYFVVDDPTFPIGDWQTVVFSATEHTLNGVSYGDDYEVVEFETPQNLKLFGFDNNGTMGVGYVDVAYCKLWDNGVLVRDLVPARRNSDNVLGMYDTVSGTFLTNDGTDNFVAGPTTVPTPDAPMGIVSNNGVLKYASNMANVNAQTALIGYYISTSGVVTADANNWLYQDYIPVSPNTKYTLTMSSPVYYVTISEYSTADDSGFIRRNAGASGDNTTLTITTDANTNFIRFGTNIDRAEITLERVLAINWQLNKGNSMPYEPYRGYIGVYADGTVETIEDTIGNTATAEILLSLPNYTDEQQILSGLMTKKVGVKIFDGTESWTRATNADASGNRVFYFDFSDKKTGNNLPMLSTHFSYTGSASYTTLVSGAFLSNATTTSVYFDGNGIKTVSDWKQWLADQATAGTPVIVIYPLATPTTEFVTGQHLQVTDGDNTLEITQASLSGLQLEAEYTKVE